MASESWMGSFASPVPIRCRGPVHLYSAQSRQTGRGVVVVVAPRLSASEARARLERLARLHRLLASDHVPGVAGADIDSEMPWVALDCDAVADMETVADCARQTGDKLDMERAAVLGKTLMEALAEVHRTRDPETGRLLCLGSLGPSNVLFGAGGNMSIVGFGAGPLSNGSIAPEVATGELPTPSSDVFVLITLIRGHADVVNIPPIIRRVVAGHPVSDAKMLVLWGWSNVRILAGPPSKRPTMEQTLANARAMWRILGFENPDIEGFRRWVSAQLSDPERLDDGPPSTDQPCIRVGHEAAWVETPNRIRHTLRARRPLRRLLLALAVAHRDQPGTAVSVDRLLEAGWPGESPMPEAAMNRVYVAISTLRKLGLADTLQRWDGGYRLDPNVRCRLE